MCRLVYGDIAKGKKFVKIFYSLVRFLNGEVVTTETKLRDLVIMFEPTPFWPNNTDIITF
jgi:hypothetical protein